MAVGSPGPCDCSFVFLDLIFGQRSPALAFVNCALWLHRHRFATNSFSRQLEFHQRATVGMREKLIISITPALGCKPEWFT
jgi:hypothetical protein